MIQSLAYWVVLAVAVPLFWALPTRLRSGFLAAVSAALLATVAPWVVLGLTVWTTTFVLLLRRPGTRRPAFLVFALGLLAQLMLFKYLPGLFPQLFGLDFLVPLGLSFFTFKLMHYGIEVMRGGLPEHRLGDVLAWILLFPIFTAGPIERFDHFVTQAESRWSLDATVTGLTRIAHGLIKRFVLAEWLMDGLFKAEPAAALLDRWELVGTGEVWLFVIRSFLVLYLDFSGYCDIAIGSARLFGLRIQENFDWPIFAHSPSDFWQRWHITLAAWCRSYVYMPAIGLTRNPWVATYATFLVMGLWHAGSLQWVLWGLYHGTGVVSWMVWRRFRKKRRLRWPERRPVRWLAIAATFLFVCGARAFTGLDGAGGVTDSLRMLGKLVGLPA